MKDLQKTMKPTVTFYLPVPYKKALQELAAAQGITMGLVMRQAFTSYLGSQTISRYPRHPFTQDYIAKMVKRYKGHWDEVDCYPEDGNPEDVQWERHISQLPMRIFNDIQSVGLFYDHQNQEFAAKAIFGDGFHLLSEPSTQWVGFSISEIYQRLNEFCVSGEQVEYVDWDWVKNFNGWSED